MKLLSKNEITSLKGFERKLEIEEGAKLARKIDVLRETASKEEASLAKFRTESLKKLKEDIQALVNEKSQLETDIQRLEERRKEALKPITNEIEALKEEKTALDAEREDILAKKLSLLDLDHRLDEREKQLVIEEGRVKDERAKSVVYLQESFTKREEAEKIIRASQEKSRLTDEEINARVKATNQREAEVAVRERENEYTRLSLRNKEQELNNRERFINDKYQTLLRAEQRNGKPKRKKR